MKPIMNPQGRPTSIYTYNTWYANAYSELLHN